MALVKTPFILSTPEGQHRFQAGDEITGELLEHWYVKAHLADAAEAEQPEAPADEHTANEQPADEQPADEAPADDANAEAPAEAEQPAATGKKKGK